MSQIETYKQQVAMKLARHREAARQGVDMAEVFAGAFASGYAAETMPEVAGVPTDAALALVLGTAGMTLAQRDMKWLAVGFAAGFLRDKGRETAKSMPLGNVLPFAAP